MRKKNNVEKIEVQGTKNYTQTVTNEEILRFAYDSGIIDLAYVQEQIEMRKKQELLAMHKYKIWLASDGRWATKVLKEDGKLKLIKKSTKEKLEDFLISYYEEKPLTVEQVYQQAIQKKIEYKEIGFGTVERYEQDFNRYFGALKELPIGEVTESMIEDIVKRNIANMNLKPKAFSNMRTLLYLIFKYARKQRLTDVDILETFDYMSISKKSMNHIKKDADTQVFKQMERKRIVEYLTNNLDVLNLGLLLLFKTGMRVGELAALKKEDIHDNFISITKTEIRYKLDGIYHYDIKDSPKTESGIRKVEIADHNLWLLQLLRERYSQNEYVFEMNGERIKTYQFRKRLYIICKHLGIQNKSPHKIRKTYTTQLIDSGMDESAIISQVGHSNFSCSKNYYYFDDKDRAEKRQQLNKVMGL